MGDNPRTIVLSAFFETIETAAKVTELLVPGSQGGAGEQTIGDRTQLGSQPLLHDGRKAVNCGATKQLVEPLENLRRHPRYWRR